MRSWRSSGLQNDALGDLWTTKGGLGAVEEVGLNDSAVGFALHTVHVWMVGDEVG